MNEKELKHFGIIGMKWGVRRNRAGANASSRDAANLRKAGYTKEADALDENARRLNAKADETQAKIDSKKKARDDKDEVIASKKREEAKKVVEDWLEEERYLKALEGKPFNEAESRKRIEREVKNIAGLDINASIKTVRQERLKDAALATAVVLAVAANVAARVYVSNQQNKAFTKFLANTFGSSDIKFNF